MPLSATLHGHRVISTQLTDAEWETLRQESKASHGCLLMGYSGYPCYGRTSKLGLRHFAHRRGAPDDLPPWAETAEHLLSKALVVAAAERLGWEVRTEVPSEDRSWIADTLVEKDGRRIAFEVQWSRQSDDDYEFRTQRYADQGIECVWLARRCPTLMSDYYLTVGASFETICSVPAVYPLTVDTDDLSAHAGGLPVQETIAAILEDRTGAVRRLRIHHHECWRCEQPMWTWGSLIRPDAVDRTPQVARRVALSLLGMGQDLSARPVASTGPQDKKRKLAPGKRHQGTLPSGRTIGEKPAPHPVFICPGCGGGQSNVGADVHAGVLPNELLVPSIRGSRSWRAIARKVNRGWIYTLPDEHWNTGA